MTDEQLIIAARHGQTEWSASGQHTGRTDIALTAEGEAQAERLGRWLADERFDHVWTSPLQRAAETCRLAGFGDRAEVVEDLQEWDYGEYEGRTRTDIHGEDPGWDVWTSGAPGGESVEQMAARVQRLVGRLGDTSGRVLLFAHGHLLRSLACAWIDLPIRAGARLPLDTAAMGHLGRYHGRRALHRWNVTAP